MEKDQLLEELLKCFSVDSRGDLHWPYIEGISVGEVAGEEVQRELIKLKKEFEND